MAAQTPRLAFGSRASDVRRDVGPTAWVVLEELVLVAGRQERRCAIGASARSLADRLGLAKDTAAGALRRLSEHGLVEREVQRRAESGTFSVGAYRLNDLALADVLVAFTVARRPSVRTSSRSARSQATLFDSGAHE